MKPIALLLLPFVFPVTSPAQERPAKVKAPSVIHVEAPDIDKCHVRPTAHPHALVHMRITIDGKPKDEAVKTSSGDACLDAAALTSVHKYRFKPAQREGQPVETDLYIDVDLSHP